MATEYVVGDSIVASLTIKAPAPPATASQFRALVPQPGPATPDGVLAARG